MGMILDGIILRDTKTGISSEYAIQDSQLRARFERLIANSGDTGSNSELIDIRVGADGKQYTTAGQAVREQVTDLQNQVDELNKDGLILNDSYVSAKISNWLLQHPEATTTVVDGSITKEKLEENFLYDIRKARYYSSIEDMKLDTELKPGQIVKTLGYYTPNDGDGASYFIRDALDGETNDGNSLYLLDNGLVAELIMDRIIRNYGDKYTVYTQFSYFDLDYKTATPIDICKALPNFSVFITNLIPECEGFGGSWAAKPYVHPNILAIIKIVKLSPYRCVLYWQETANKSTRQYIGSIYSLDNYETYTWTGWEPIGQPSEAKQRNDAKAAKELVECAESYLGTTWVYDQRVSKQAPRDSVFNIGHVFNENGYPMIDCMTLVRLALYGIPYKNSSYTDENRHRWREHNVYPWATNPTGVHLRELVHWCLNSGYEINPGRNYENLQAGDLVFWGTHPDKPSSFNDFMNQPRCVDHVGMYTGRWVPDPNRNNELHPQTIEIAYYESPNVNVVKHRFVDEVAPAGAITSHSVEHLVMFARIPLNTKGHWTNKNPNDNPLNIIHTSKMKTGYTIEIVGDGNPISLWIGSQNMAGTITRNYYEPSTGAITKWSARAMLELMPISIVESEQRTIPNILNPIPQGVYYFDTQLNYLGTANEYSTIDGYMYRTYAKTDGSDITDDELNTIQKELTINSKNYYDRNENQCSPIIIKGTLAKGSIATIDTSTGEILIEGSGSLAFVGDTRVHPSGNKYIYMPTGQETDIYWE